MKRILITGTAGNIGTEVVHYLCELDNKSEIIVAARNVESAKNHLLKVYFLSLFHDIFISESPTGEA